MKIGRNDPCPCGSGKKYKKCCLGKPDDLDYSDITNFPEIYKETRKAARFKECLHPDKEHCSEKIIGAHSIQNNKILSKIADNGILYMPCPKPDLSFSLQTKYGRKEASVFTGFCGYHDKITFQPIEDYAFTGSQEQVFLYIYRTFALEYHKKKEVARMEQLFFSKKPSIANMPGRAISGKTGFDMAISDFEEEKVLFDKALLEKRYDALTSIIWEFDGFSNFAATGGEAPMYDFSGKKLQDLLNPNIPVRHIYICVFPENNKTYVIIAWLKEYNELFSTIQEKLNLLSEKQKKNYINNTIPIIAENVVIKPSSWDALSETKKQAFSILFLGLADIMALDGKIYNRLEEPTFDLFQL
ncbi:MAG: SEC-C domain-containing protein [Clostridia bacterium]|nr:SEC-C domain-containing protein [Clostridia bacterium]